MVGVLQEALTTIGQDFPYRLCTPNPLPDTPVLRPDQDISVSVTQHGSLVDNTGLFAKAHAGIAAVTGMDQARLMVGGSTGAVRTIAWSLVLAHGVDTVVLVAGNAHRSVIHAAEQFGLSLRFLPADSLREALLPPTPHVVAAALEQLAAVGVRPAAVWLTSPTYEGLVADVAGILPVVHRDGIPLVVDEAWGPHSGVLTGFPSAMQAGADIVTQSTHKLGGSLQQSALLAWNEPQVSTDSMQTAIRQTSTTSPSYGLVASAEHAILTVHSNPDLLARPVARIHELKERLASLVPGIGFLEDIARGVEGVVATDPMRTTIDLSAFAVTGHHVASGLAALGIIVEKATAHTVTLLGLFNQPDNTAKVTAQAVADIVTCVGHAPAAPPDLVRRAEPVVRHPRLELHHMIRRTDTMTVAADDAIGHIAAETVEVYPPGIPLVMPGYPIRQQDLDLLQETALGGGRVVANDPTLTTIRVLRPPVTVAA